MTIKIKFTEAEIKQLAYERYHHRHPHVQRKMEALWLKSQGAQHKDILKYSNSHLNKYHLKTMSKPGQRVLLSNLC